jgi:hypothetical protein
MRIRFINENIDPQQFVCIISQRGCCTIPGLKTLKYIYQIQKMVENLFLNLWDKETQEKFKNLDDVDNFNGSIGILNVNESDIIGLENENYNNLKEFEEAEGDYLHFIKSESYFVLIDKNGKKRKPLKYFNKSAFKKPKKKFDKRLNSMKSLNTENIPVQGAQFYFKLNRYLYYQNKKKF